MSLARRLTPNLMGALLGSTAIVQLPPPERPAHTNANLAAKPGEPGHVPDRADVAQEQGAPVYRFAADADDLATQLDRGLTAARSLIADPRPYKIDTAALERMVSAIEVIAANPNAMDVTIPAASFEMLAECIRADRARACKRGAAWAVAETVAERAGKVMFAFSEARRREA